MTAPITLTAYAKHRGVSTVAVSKAVKHGRLAACVGRDQHDRPTIVDVDLADREWAANTRQASHRPPTSLPGVPRGTPDFEIADRIADAAASRPAPQPTPQGKIMDLRATGLPDGVPTYNVSQAVRAQAAARREAALADQAELDLKERRGELVPADQARSDVLARYSNVRTKMLKVPSLLAQQMPDIAARVVPAAEVLITEALEELAIG